jgi:hypothetical protein
MGAGDLLEAFEGPVTSKLPESGLARFEYRRMLGEPVRRQEDPTFLRGESLYTVDLNQRRPAYAYIVT